MTSIDTGETASVKFFMTMVAFSIAINLDFVVIHLCLNLLLILC